MKSNFNNEDEHPDLIWTHEDMKKVKYISGGMGLFIIAWITFLLLVIAPSCPNKNTAVSLYEYGKYYMSEQDFVKAEKYFTKAININPNYFDAYIQRAKANEQLDSLQKCINDYTFLLDSAKLSVDKKSEYYYIRANIYYKYLQDTLSYEDLSKSCDLNNNRACDLLRKRYKK